MVRMRSLLSKRVATQPLNQPNAGSVFRNPTGDHAARLIESSMEKTIQQKYVTYDFERQMQGATKVKTSDFATRMIENMG